MIQCKSRAWDSESDSRTIRDRGVVQIQLLLVLINERFGRRRRDGRWLERCDLLCRLGRRLAIRLCLEQCRVGKLERKQSLALQKRNVRSQQIEKGIALDAGGALEFKRRLGGIGLKEIKQCKKLDDDMS